jgi:ABC-type amino acid transport substrate-binding protein
MRTSYRTGLCALAVACVAQALPALAGPTLERIRTTGTIQMGYRDDAAPFSFRDREGRVRGYSVELCEKAAAEIGKAAGANAIRIEWRALDAASRLEAVARGDVDLECGTTTISLSRMASVDFSVPIYVDGGAVLVRNASKLARLADLKGKRVAVIPGTTTEQALARTLTALDAPAIVVPIASYKEGIGLLSTGRRCARARPPDGTPTSCPPTSPTSRMRWSCGGTTRTSGSRSTARWSSSTAAAASTRSSSGISPRWAGPGRCCTRCST